MQIELAGNRAFAMKIEKTIKKLKNRIVMKKIIDEINTLEE